MNRTIKNITIVLALGSFAGCAAFRPMPLSDGPCRDPSTGRYISCGGGGGSGGGPDSSGLLIGLGILAGVVAVAGIGYLIATNSSSSTVTQTEDPKNVHLTSDPVGLTPSTSGSCNFPVESVRVCLSSRGYSFAIPAPGVCATGSVPVRILRLACSDLRHPAYHACLTASGGWNPVHSWETCLSQGYTDAPGDFVPPGRSPTQGVAPDAPSP